MSNSLLLYQTAVKTVFNALPCTIHLCSLLTVEIIAAGTYFIRGVLEGLNVAGPQGRTGSKNRPWTLIQTGPPEPAPVYATTATLLMHPHSVFDVKLV